MLYLHILVANIKVDSCFHVYEFSTFNCFDFHLWASLVCVGYTEA